MQHYTAPNASAAAGEGAAAAAGPGEGADVTFTATTSASGTLLVGSSREFSGWDSAAAPEVVDAIMTRATAFLPGLAAVRPGDVLVRVGLRPYAVVRPWAWLLLAAAGCCWLLLRGG